MKLVQRELNHLYKIVELNSNMKKLSSVIALYLLIFTAKSQTPRLNTLIRYVNTPVADITEEVISKNGWELTKSEVLDSVITLQFDAKDATLVIKKVKDYKNEVFLVCNKIKYDNLNKSLLELKPNLISSKVNEKGHIVKTYWGEKYGYRVSIAPKSIFAFQVYDKANELMRELIESRPDERAPSEEKNTQASNLSETPFALRNFTNLVMPDDDGKKTGKIAVRIKVDNVGNVIDATPGVKGTTLNDRDLWQKCRASIMNAKMNTTESPPSIQVGIVVFNFRVK